MCTVQLYPLTFKFVGHGVGGGAGAGGGGGGGPAGTGIGWLWPSRVIFGVKVLQSRETVAFVQRRVKMPAMQRPSSVFSALLLVEY